MDENYEVIIIDDVKRLQEENANLKAELERLKKEAFELKSLKEENANLNKLISEKNIDQGTVFKQLQEEIKQKNVKLEELTISEKKLKEQNGKQIIDLQVIFS